MASTAYESIELDIQDGVATITFNLPQYGNALNLKGVQETLDALHKAEARQDVGRHRADRSRSRVLFGFQPQGDSRWR